MKGGIMFNQKDIVIIPFPYSDLSLSKRRPALIISNEKINKTQDRICCLVTTKPNKEYIQIEKDSNLKFVVVCGGGSIARRYIHGMDKINADVKTKSLAGISATRMNARFMSYFFGLNIERFGITHKKRRKIKEINE